MNYIIRIGYDPDWALKQWNEGYSIAQTLKGIAEELENVEVLASELTFSVFRMPAETAGSCEERINQKWELRKFEPKCPLNFMIVEEEDSDVCKVLTQMYQVYFGWDDYLHLCTDMANTYPLVKKLDNCMSYLNMNYLLAMDEGCGFQTMVNSFSDFLQKLGVFPAYNASTYRYVVAAEDGLGGTEAKTIIDELWDEDHYNTVIGIDISYYLDTERRNEFREFLKQLLRLKDKCVFMLRVPSLSQHTLNELRDQIDDIMEIQVLKTGPFNDLTLLDKSRDDLARLGFYASLGVLELVVDRVHREKMDGHFYGFKTVRKIVNEIVWTKARYDANEKHFGRMVDFEKLEREHLNPLEVSKQDAGDGYEELADLVGMEEITNRIEEIVAQLTIAVNNPKMDRPCLHMRFVGAPGTGKTTVARIVGKIFKQKGILRKGDFFEYEARSLCGEYVGQTAPRTHAVCRDAYGSVLFIDEAYGLYCKDNDKDYGKEALTALIAEMENHRDDMVIIMAGYTDDMEQLMEGNSGLRSRMPFVLEFKSYTREQMVEIYMRMARKHFACEDGLEEAVAAFFGKLADQYIHSKEFSNARFVRNLYERTWAKAARRCAGTFTTDITLTKEDFENASMEKEFSEKLMLEKKIGFQ